MRTQLLLIAAIVSFAQAPVAFEVASVKQNNAGGTRIQFQTPPGHLTATNAPLRFLIRQAYRVPEARITGGPAWLDTQRFDITANAPSATATSDEVRAMLRALLTDRFGLKMRQEEKEVPVYVLHLARTDRKLGTRLKESTTNCAGRGPTLNAGRVECGILVSQAPAGASLRGGGTTLAEFTRMLGDFLDRPILDETHLSGSYDLDLEFSAIRSALPGEQIPGGLSTNPNELPTVFTAIQEQLGLKLDSQRKITDIYVVDSASQPSGN